MFVLHADADAFFASVEQRDDPRLRGRPVIVGGGVVLAASYEAKAYGIRTAMGGRQARRLCPDAIVVPPRFSAYTEASRALFAVFEDLSPVVEGLSIDEAFLDVRGMERIAGTPAQIAARLDRLSACPRARATLGRGDRRDARRRRRPDHAADADGASGRTDGRASPPLRRLRARDALAHAAVRDREHADHPDHGSRSPRAR